MIFQTSPGVARGVFSETAETQASLQSPLFLRLVEDGDRRSDLIWASPVTVHFFTTLFPPIFRAQG